ncbi:SDR family oxidoreductase [Nocardia beijingensis]|uniref:SDR family oxidoreductase n=1 Tax=Nocardia beijingensis TaxID=95162 RepID=UPI003F4CC44C
MANCIGGETLIGRAGTAQDMANAALFFASDLSAWITGVGLVVTAAPRRQPRTPPYRSLPEVAEKFHTA